MAELDKKKKNVLVIGEFFSQYFPELRKKLVLADLTDTPAMFLQKMVMATIFFTVALVIITFVIFSYMNLSWLYLIPAAFVYVVIGFNYLMLYPDAMIIKRRKEIDYEVAFAGRHLVIALKSGMPLFSAITSLSTDYGYVSKEFARISEKVSLGTPLTQAIRDAASTNPSKYLVRVLLQISNSLASGADVGSSLETVIDQISREQMIQLREYGQKLTPFVMFYMMFGIILPAIGIAGVVVLTTVISAAKLGLPSSILTFAFALIIIVQYLLFGVIESSRPKYLL